MYENCNTLSAEVRKSAVMFKSVASGPKFWPRPQGFGLGLASISLSYYVIGYSFVQKSCKIREFCYFFGSNLKSYVVNHYLLLFHNYFQPWPRSHSPGLGLDVLASFNITENQIRLRQIVIGFNSSTHWPSFLTLHFRTKPYQ